MYRVLKINRRLLDGIPLLLLVLAVAVGLSLTRGEAAVQTAAESGSDAFIQWVDFDIPYSALNRAMRLDVETYGTGGETHLDWVELLAVLGTKYGGDFSKYRERDLTALAERIQNGETIEDITKGYKNYAYYQEAYDAVLGGFLGEYELQTEREGELVWEKRYGLKAYCPIAKGYAYNDYDDFGSSRSYGYARRHLGHDLMAVVGTPVVAVESGTVEVLGWNQYGGWRVGIRSFDGRRYYYYAHLRQNRPYAEGLEAGDVVMAGDVIGYVGRTGYSAKENVNGITSSHLHLGLQLIFDESQKEGPSEIWVDLYSITRLLSENRSETVRNAETKEHTRKYLLLETVPEDRFIPAPVELGAESG